MLNNKAYVLTTVLLFLLFLIASMAHFYSLNLKTLLYNGILIETSISEQEFDFDSYSLCVLSSEVLKAYQVLSSVKSTQDLKNLISGNTKGYSIRNNGVEIFVYVPRQFSSEQWINMSILPLFINKTILYPVFDFLEELSVFSPSEVQDCLNSLFCSSSNFYYSLNFCLSNYSSHGDFRLINITVPLLESDVFNVKLGFINELNITYLFPFEAGFYSFNC